LARGTALAEADGMSKIAWFASALALVTLASNIASAEEEADELIPVPPGVSQPSGVSATAAGPEREGFTLGFALGPGHLTAAGDDIDLGTTAGLSLRLGTAIAPEFLLQLNLEAVRSEDEKTESGGQLSFIGGSLQAYLHPRVYLVGGVGVARVTLDQTGEVTAASERAPGLLLGAGVELVQTRHFALSLEGRLITASFESGTSSGSSVQLGFQWW
jgi:hypothetical protein